MLQPFGPEIWITDGDTLDISGFRYPTRMAVIRLSGGGLLIWSPVAFTDDLRTAVDALGPVTHIVAPNDLHHLWMGDWIAAYPDAKTHAAPGLRKKRGDLRLDADLTDTPDPDWAAEADQVIIRGNLITQEVVLFHRASGTAIFTDLLQQFPDGWFSGWRRVIAKLDLMIGAEPAVPRKFRLAFTDRKAARASIGKVLDWKVDKVLVAHGAPVPADGHAVLTRAFGWLMR